MSCRKNVGNISNNEVSYQLLKQKKQSLPSQSHLEQHSSATQKLLKKTTSEYIIYGRGSDHFHHTTNLRNNIADQQKEQLTKDQTGVGVIAKQKQQNHFIKSKKQSIKTPEKGGGAKNNYSSSSGNIYKLAQSKYFQKMAIPGSNKKNASQTNSKERTTSTTTIQLGSLVPSQSQNMLALHRRVKTN